MSDNVKGVGFTQDERKICIKALMTYQKVDMELYLGTRSARKKDHFGPCSSLPFLPPSEDEKKTIDLLIGDFKGPSWDRAGDVP